MKLRVVFVCSLLCMPVACGDDGAGQDEGAEPSTGSPGTADSGAADSGTADSGAADSSTGAAPFDEAEVIALGGMYTSELVKINVDPFGSAHGLADTVNVYVNAEAEAAFRSLDPQAPAEVDLPEGTLIVKEHLDDEQVYDGYLMMYRGPDGYAPQTGDWFWARIDASGTAQETGPSGRVDFCINCHVPAPSFVFGVEADNQT